MKKLKMAIPVFVGGILFVFGAYLSVMDHLIENEMEKLEQGSSATSHIAELAGFPFVRKDVVLYNANLDKIQSAGEIRPLLQDLHKILNESTNQDIRFRTSLLLAHIYTSIASGESAEKGLAMAVEMYVQALKIKPDDIFAKLALEKLLDQAQPDTSNKVKKEIKQRKPFEQGEKWKKEDKGDDI